MITTQPAIDDREWSLILELLESEGRELPHEIRHTTSKEYAETLSRRRDMVESLIGKLRTQKATN